MGNICCGSESVPCDPAYPGTNAQTGTTPSNADTSSTLIDFSQERSSLRSSSWSTVSDYSHSCHSVTTSVASLKFFSLTDLKSASRNFRPKSIIEEGFFGIVYKGYVDEHSLVPSRAGQGMAIAIKKLKLEGFQGHKEWLAEVHYLGALRHTNLVKLIGFCAEGCNRLLVYEYMPRGSLENHLFRKGQYGSIMQWETRMKIAIGAAKGLAFLHDAERRVIYRVLNAANILLDVDYNPKLSDCGLAKDRPMDEDTRVSTPIVGTVGYAAPELLATGHLSAKSDVYSFGVVLLELKTVDKNRPPREEKLVEWAKPQLGSKRQVMRIVDERLQGQVSSRATYPVAQLALRCLNELAKPRPLMKDVVEYLEQLPVSIERRA